MVCLVIGWVHLFIICVNYIMAYRLWKALGGRGRPRRNKQPKPVAINVQVEVEERRRPQVEEERRRPQVEEKKQPDNQ